MMNQFCSSGFLQLNNQLTKDSNFREINSPAKFKCNHLHLVMVILDEPQSLNSSTEGTSLNFYAVGKVDYTTNHRFKSMYTAITSKIIYTKKITCVLKSRLLLLRSIFKYLAYPFLNLVCVLRPRRFSTSSTLYFLMRKNTEKPPREGVMIKTIRMIALPLSSTHCGFTGY